MNFVCTFQCVGVHRIGLFGLRLLRLYEMEGNETSPLLSSPLVGSLSQKTHKSIANICFAYGALPHVDQQRRRGRGLGALLGIAF